MTIRSPLWFVVAAVIGIAGFVGAFLYAMPRVEAFGASLHQVVMPGSVTVTLDKAGPYTIFAESGSVIDGRLYDSPPPRGARITLTGEASSKTVALSAPHASVDYSIGSRKGHAVLSFTIDQPGLYRIASTGTSDQGYVLAIAQGSAMGSISGMFGTIMVAVAIVIGCLGVAGFMVVVTVMQRDRAKRAASK